MTSDKFLTELAAKVKAVNLANQAVQIVQNKLIEEFKPFVGHVIQKADKTLMKRVESKICTDFGLPEGVKVWYNTTSKYYLTWGIQVCVNYDWKGDYYNTYSERTAYIGEMSDSRLIKLSEKIEKIHIHKFEEVAKLFEELDEAEKRFIELQGEVSIFR